MGVCGQLHAPAALPPGKRPGNHCIGCWVGPRAGLDGCQKSRPPPGFDPRTVQPVASRYTDYDIPTHWLGTRFLNKLLYALESLSVPKQDKQLFYKKEEGWSDED